MPAQKKRLLRQDCKKNRARLFKENPEAGEDLKALFFSSFALPSDAIVGGYWPIGSELDIKPLLSDLIERGVSCALPTLTQKGLLYREWHPDLSFLKGEFDILEPSPESPEVMPTIVLVPLLAFDKFGHRLGYGKGHFDCFLTHHDVLSIGVGFVGQEIDEVPTQSHDFALDFVLTNKSLVRPKEG